jgi:CRP/FNR family transcriptional regulator, cyclic AMP receptor protein
VHRNEAIVTNGCPSEACKCIELAGPAAVLHSRCFEQIWLFEGAPHEALCAVAKRLVRKVLAAGEDLFRQGDCADSIYLIKMGSVKLWKVTEEGRSATLDIRKAGDLLGESVLLEEGTYPVGATCLEPTLTCGFDKKTFETLVLDHPDIGLVVIRNLSRRIQQLSAKVGALSEPNLADRVYEVLVNVAWEVGARAPGGWTISFPLTHEEIGFLVGAHRVSVSRALARLRDMGKIRTSGRQLFICDLAIAS